MQKLYYSISDVSKIVDEEQHILRYWEKEFTNIKPRKNRAGNRVYSGKDLAVIKAIKKLLRDDKISLKVAKTKINEIDLSSFDILDEAINENKIENSSITTDKLNVNSDADIAKFSKSDLEELKELLSDVKELLINRK
ncbi:hypothetical protein MASR1M45_04180 [Candidatus Kapaibacterium sp.]